MEYKATFTIGERDLVRFYMHQFWKNQMASIVIFAVIGMLLSFLFANGRVPAAGIAAVMAVTLCAVVGAFYLSYRFGIQRKVRKSAVKSGVSTYQQEVRINGFGVRVEAQGKTGRLSFDKLVLVEETKQYLYLYMTKEVAWLLPKDQMEHPEKDLAALRELFEKVIPAKQLRMKHHAA